MRSAMVLNARAVRRARRRDQRCSSSSSPALVWSPLFFAGHEVTLAGYLAICHPLCAGGPDDRLFRAYPSLAALLMLPYVVWLSFASVLSYQMHNLNPDAESLAATAAHTEI